MKTTKITEGDALERMDGKERYVSVDRTVRFHGQHERDWIDVSVDSLGGIRINSSGRLTITCGIANDFRTDLQTTVHDAVEQRRKRKET